MRHKRSLLQLVLILLCLSVFSIAQSWSGILDSSRAIDWSNAGIPGGIPADRTQCGATIQASTYGNGASDASAGIQAALNGCGQNQYVLLGIGTFRLNSGLSVPSNVTLRGSGAQNTILSANNKSGAVVTGGQWNSAPNASNSVAITSGSTTGSQSVVLASASGISVGSYLLITELNDPSFVSIAGAEGKCTYCDNIFGGTRVRGQIVEVTSVSGTTVGIIPGLYSTFSLTPWATYFSMKSKYIGVENFQIYSNNMTSGNAPNIALGMCAYCWVRGVESNGTSNNYDHLDVEFSYRDEVRDSYFTGCSLHQSGIADCDIFLWGKTSGTLVENNVIERTHGGLELDWGAAGNVLAYNYIWGVYDTTSGSTNTTMMDIDSHGAHPQFNLYEGNVTSRIQLDVIHGSASHATYFRNWALGTSLICSPQSDTPHAAFSCSTSKWSSESIRAFDFTQSGNTAGATAMSLYTNLVANVAGSAALAALGPEYRGGTDACTACGVSPYVRDYSGTGYDFNYGYSTSGDSTGYCASRTACAPYSTAFLHGNYSNAVSSVEVWANGITHTLPASFFRSSRPAFWGSLPWPAIGPDVTGGSGPGGHTSVTASNPAQSCFSSTSKTTDGTLAFDADTCYGQSVSRPAAPKVTNCSVCTGSTCSSSSCTIQP